MTDHLTKLIDKQLFITQQYQIKTDSIQVNFIKNYAEKFPNNLNVQDCSIELHSMCKIIEDSYPNCKNIVILQRVRIFFVLWAFG